MTSEPDDGGQTGLIRRRQATGVGLSALFSAAVSYVVLLIAAHTLPAADNALFLAYWALLFGTFGIITGLNPEAARSVFDHDRPTRQLPRVVPAAIGFGTGTCVVLGLTGVVWAGRVLDTEHSWLVAVVVLAGIAFSGHLAVTGVLAGRQRWHGVILATVWEASLRLACVLLALLFVDTLAGLAIASAVSAAAWLLLLGRHDVRSALAAHGVASLHVQVGNFAHACTASASSAALVVGFPVLIRLTSAPAEYLGAAGLLLAITLTRAPLMVPLNAYQSVALTHFLRRREEGLRPLYVIAGAVLATTAVAAGLAALAGPWLFDVLVGDRYAVSGGLLAGLTVGAGLLALLTLTGACCLAVGSHRTYAAGWVFATIVAVLVLLLPVGLAQRTVLSLVVAPVFGMLVHASSVWAAYRTGNSRGDVQQEHQ